jgi:hypothetical protein
MLRTHLLDDLVIRPPSTDLAFRRWLADHSSLSLTASRGHQPGPIPPEVYDVLDQVIFDAFGLPRATSAVQVSAVHALGGCFGYWNACQRDIAVCLNQQQQPAGGRALVCPVHSGGHHNGRVTTATAGRCVTTEGEHLQALSKPQDAATALLTPVDEVLGTSSHAVCPFHHSNATLSTHARPMCKQKDSASNAGVAAQRCASCVSSR